MPDGRKRQVGLEHQVRMVEKDLWPTPNAQGGTGYMSGSNRDTWRPTLEGAVQMSPDGPPPKIAAEEFKGKGRKAALKKTWPTPTTRDYRSGKHSEKTWNKNSRPLGEAVIRWPTPTSQSGGGPHGLDGGQAARKKLRENTTETEARQMASGQLNPTWTEWLMGFPLGWTDLKDSATP